MHYYGLLCCLLGLLPSEHSNSQNTYNNYADKQTWIWGIVHLKSTVKIYVFKTLYSCAERSMCKVDKDYNSSGNLTESNTLIAAWEKPV